MKHLGIFLVVAAFALSGCASMHSGYSFTQLREVGEKYLAAGDAPNALKFLTMAESQKPNDPTTQYDLGLAYQKRGLDTESIVHFQKALKLKPKYPEASNALGVVYAERGQVDLARQCFQSALSDPMYQTPQLALFNMGRLYEKQGNLDSALVQYQQAVKFYPGYGSAWVRIGHILEAMHRTDEARNAYGKATRATPDLAEAHMRYGMLAFRAGDLDAAMYSLDRVTKLAPNTSMADEARRELEKVKIAIVKSRPQPAPIRQIAPPAVQAVPRYEIPQWQPQSHPSYPVEKPAAARSDNFAPPAREISPAAPVAHGAPVEVIQSSSGPVLSNRPQAAPAPAAPQAPSAAESRPAVEVPHRDAPEAGSVPQPAPAEQPVPVAAPEAAPPASSPGVEPAAPEPPQFRYIVQLGSFTDQGKAEELRNRLRQKGYAAIITRVKRKGALVYFVQLKAESSRSKASTLKTQLGAEVSDAKIIQIPVEAKPPSPPQQ